MKIPIGLLLETLWSPHFLRVAAAPVLRPARFTLAS
jgi:hypothetical protein